MPFVPFSNSSSKVSTKVYDSPPKKDLRITETPVLFLSVARLTKFSFPVFHLPLYMVYWDRSPHLISIEISKAETFALKLQFHARPCYSKWGTGQKLQNGLQVPHAHGTGWYSRCCFQWHHLGDVEEGWIFTASFFSAVVRDMSQAWAVFPWEFCFLDAFRRSSLHSTFASYEPPF